jgi:hypothetical protein
LAIISIVVCMRDDIKHVFSSVLHLGGRKGKEKILKIL